MFEAGNTIIQNYISTPSNSWLDLIKVLATPLVTLVIGIFTISTTFKTFRRTMFDNLDSKSGWRKTLFNIAGTSNITMDEVYQLRASVRFKKNKISNEKKSFANVTNEIIDFCDNLDNVNKSSLRLLTFNEQEMIRIFCRYLLANQWELLQLSPIEQYIIEKNKLNEETQGKKKKEEKEEKRRSEKYSWHQKFKYSIIFICNKNKIKSRVAAWETKEEELIDYTLKQHKVLIENNSNTLK